MANWGAAQWMTNPAVQLASSPPAVDPYYASELCFPANGAQNVPASTVLRAFLVSPLGGAGPATVRLDGVDVTGAFYPYRQASFALGNRHAIELYIAEPFEPGSEHLFEVFWAQGPDTFGYRSQFTVARDPEDYLGTSANALEQLLLTPCTRFLNLEPVRQRLLDVAIRDSSSAYRNGLAARALYQIAYDTELSALLNPYYTPDNRALTSRVRSKRSTLDMALLLEPYSNAIESGIESLFTSNALTSEYRNGLSDARDSLLYTYRVAAPVVTVLLARAIEASAGEATL